MKARVVSNRVWMIFLPASLVVVCANLLSNPDQLQLSLISIAVTVIIALTIFYLGLYGGADAKALITLAVAHPISTNSLSPFLPLTTFTNSLLLMLLTIPLAPILNLHWKIKRRKPIFQGFETESPFKKVLALFFCVKKERSQIKPYHILAEENVQQNGEVHNTLKIFRKVPEEDIELDDTLPDDVFVAFSLPMLPFLTIAYMLNIAAGDLLLSLLKFFLT